MDRYVVEISKWLLLTGLTFFIAGMIFPYQERVHMMVNTNYGLMLLELFLSAGISGMIVFGRGTGKPEGADNSRIYRILSDDERKALKEIRRTKSISQDTLKFRLGWSKAKTSSIVTRLEKYGLIQRERIGKTYRLVPED